METEIGTESSVHSLVLKRKRTQRQRPLSSSDDALTMTTSSSSSSEDQEVAKCLILLAQGLALGGHRASHKKLKATTTGDEHEFQNSTSDNSSCRNLIQPISVPTLQLRNNVGSSEKIRVHQCLICCAEFPSGQALGGHMRKHRVNITLTHTFTAETTTEAKDGLIITMSLSSPAHEEADEFQCSDLNLPAAAAASFEDEMSVTELSLSSKQQEQSQTLQDSGLVVSGTALVDCHY